jgi:hypothetical protein
MSLEHFSNDILEKLHWYVYRLVDPINGETFYVGKGQGNRVFHHVQGLPAAVAEDDLMPPKLDTIKRIMSDGHVVKYVVHRHGMDEKTAFEVEAALIDAYPKLTNLQGGHGSIERGPMTAEEIVELYTLEEAVFHHKLIVIDVNRSYSRRRVSTRSNLLDAVRFMWRLNLHRAKKCDYVLAQRGGVIIGVFRPEKWLPATPENFPEFAELICSSDAPKRIGFKGHEVTDARVKSLYINKRIPSDLRKAPRAPCRYVKI